jgi:hypothetical protein
LRDAPISPNDCRRHAAECIRLIQRAKAPRLKQALRERAAIWLNLAIELERSEALLADELEPSPKTRARV